MPYLHDGGLPWHIDIIKHIFPLTAWLSHVCTALSTVHEVGIQFITCTQQAKAQSITPLPQSNARNVAQSNIHVVFGLSAEYIHGIIRILAELLQDLVNVLWWWQGLWSLVERSERAIVIQEESKAVEVRNSIILRRKQIFQTYSRFLLLA